MQKFSPTKILHITPHLGGGVGRVLLNYILGVKKNNLFDHRIICLDYANEAAKRIAKSIKLKLSDEMFNRKEELSKMVQGADIILVHWWNHPLLYDFLVRETLPPCRLIIWSHISGFHPPYVFTQKILNYPDIFVFTTPLSLEIKEVRNLSNKRKKSLRTIWSTGGVEHVRSVKPKKHAGFNIGYIGTVSYAKLHRRFLNICNRVNIPDAKFIVCGGPNEKEIKKEAEKLGIAEKFDFLGQVSDITKYLNVFDVFGYPLAAYHYGTCDQSLQESMVAGVVPVVLSNRMEKYMIKDKITGIVAKNEKDYIRSIEKLYKNKTLRHKLSRNAIKYARQTFMLSKMANDWESIFSEVLILPKTSKRWQIGDKERIKPVDVFIESLGNNYGKIFNAYRSAKSNQERVKVVGKMKKLAELDIWKSETRGTTHHYHSFFLKDKYLSIWSKIMK